VAIVSRLAMLIRRTHLALTVAMYKVVNMARATAGARKRAVPTVQVTVVAATSPALVMAKATKLVLAMVLDLAMGTENTLPTMVTIRKLLDFCIVVFVARIGGVSNKMPSLCNYSYSQSSMVNAAGSQLVRVTI